MTQDKDNNISQGQPGASMGAGSTGTPGSFMLREDRGNEQPRTDHEAQDTAPEPEAPQPGQDNHDATT